MTEIPPGDESGPLEDAPQDAGERGSADASDQAARAPGRQVGAAGYAAWAMRSLFAFTGERLANLRRPRPRGSGDAADAPAAPMRVAVDTARLRAHLSRIVGERHHRTAPAHHAQVAGYIRDVLAGHGWDVDEQSVRGPDGDGHNLIARRRGEVNPDRTWILGAHYDTVVGSPGADDNGSAVAGVLAAAECLAGARFRDSVELVAWDMEERQRGSAGSLLGSLEMARASRRERRDIAGVLDLEMIGYCRREPGTQHFPAGFGALFGDAVRLVEERERRGDFIAVVGGAPASELIDVFARAAALHDLPCVPIRVTGAARMIRHLYRSDHAPFWVRGYPAVMITDTADFRNPHYHEPSDTIETIDFEFAARVTAASMSALAALAGRR